MRLLHGLRLKLSTKNLLYMLVSHHLWISSESRDTIELEVLPISHHLVIVTRFMNVELHGQQKMRTS